MTEPARVVLVTGAGGALGSSYVRALTDAGHRVVVNDAGSALDGGADDQGRAEQVAAEARGRGAEAVASTANIADPVGADDAVQAAMDSFGRLDAVVNNAGFLRDRTLARLTVQDFDDVVQVHLRGSMLVSRAALRALRQSGQGRLVHTASAAIFGSFGQTNYAAAKLGIVGFSRSLALEEARHGITSNVVAPFARSRMTEPILGSGGVEDVPLDPDLVAPMVCYLAGPGCSVTGETFTAGGGHFARVVLGLTSGWHGRTDRPASQDDVASNLDRIMATAGMSAPVTAAEVVAPYLAGPGPRLVGGRRKEH